MPNMTEPKELLVHELADLLYAERRFLTLQFPNIEAGIEAFRSTLAAGYRPSVIRMYDEEATTRTFQGTVDLAGPLWNGIAQPTDGIGETDGR